jgi:hypothetical protein
LENRTLAGISPGGRSTLMEKPSAIPALPHTETTEGFQEAAAAGYCLKPCTLETARKLNCVGSRQRKKRFQMLAGNKRQDEFT